jgi:photosystem II stability/assembly factor-like uncharacterized protein
MRHTISLFCLLLFSGSVMFCQPWMHDASREKTSESPDFYDIQKAFYRYWTNKEPEKGKGYKPYRRWEYFMEPRVYPSGKLPVLPLWQIIEDKQKSLAMSPAADQVWTYIGPSEVPVDIESKKLGGIGRIDCIAFNPKDSLVFWAGAPTGGIWKTTDGGKHWVPTGDQLASIGISDMVIDPKNPDNLYVATGDGDSYDAYGIGIIKSTDGGMTWNSTSLTISVEDAQVFRRLLMHPANNKSMLAASSEGIYRTTDAWVTYKRVLTGHFKDLEYKPGAPAVVYAASFDYSEGKAKVYRSSDYGETFQESMSGMNISGLVDRIELAVSAANPEVVFALCSDANNGGLYGLFRSSNSGVSWTKVYGNNKINLLGWTVNGSDVGGQGWYDLSLAVSPNNANEVYVGGVNIWRSANGGSGWTLNSNWYHDDNFEYVHADHHALRYSPHGEILFSGNDGGISKTYDDGKNWQDISSGLHILQTYRFGLSVDDPDLIISGNQDNGSILMEPEGFFEVLGGDGMECFVDYNDNNIIYASMYNGDLRKSVDRGLTFTSISPSGAPDGSWVTPFVMHPTISSIVFAGYDKVYKSLNGGKSWTALPTGINLNGNIKSLAVAPSNDRYLYAASNNVMIKSTDGGSSWADITSGLPPSAITAIIVSPTDPNKLWVSFASYSANNKVYYSSSGGNTWANYSAGLPKVPVNCLLYQKDSHAGIYAGTDIGVYYRDAQLSQWTDYSGNLPNVIVNDLEIDYSASLLKAATFGRGIWQTQMNQVNWDILRADFTISHTTACINGAIHFEDHSIGSPTGYQWNFGEGAVPQTANTKGPHTVTYTTAGEKNISLTLSLGTENVTEIKTGILTIGSDIDFELIPDIINSCDTTPVTLFASGNFNYTWNPAEGLDTQSGNTVKAAPLTTTVYTVLATHGNCSARKSVTVMITGNDNICDAILLTQGINGPFNNDCATKEETEPVPPPGSLGDGCQTQDGWCDGEDRIDNSIWFKFTAPDNGLVSIASDGFDNQIAIYSSPSCNDIYIGNYIMLAANDDFPNKADYSASIQELKGLTPGKTYWVQVDGSYGGVSGTFYLNLNYYPLSDANDIPADPGPSVSVFPNPSRNGFFNLLTGKHPVSGIHLRICTLNGETLYINNYPAQDDERIIPLDLRYLPDGLYLMEVQFENKISRFKILKI